MLFFSGQLLTPKTADAAGRPLAGHLVSPLTKSMEETNPIPLLPLLIQINTQPEVTDWSGVQRETPHANRQATHCSAICTETSNTPTEKKHSDSLALRHERATVGNKLVESKTVLLLQPSLAISN